MEMYSPAKNDHVDKEKRNRSRTGLLLAKRQQDRGHHHTHPEPKTPPEHGLATSHAVQRQRRAEVADDEHELDEAGDDLGDARLELDGRNEDRRHVIDHQVNADLKVVANSNMSE